MDCCTAVSNAKVKIPSGFAQRGVGGWLACGLRGLVAAGFRFQHCDEAERLGLHNLAFDRCFVAAEAWGHGVGEELAELGVCSCRRELGEGALSILSVAGEFVLESPWREKEFSVGRSSA